MVAILDYGMGNLRSVQRAFERTGHPPTIVRAPDEIAACDRLVVPGVGAFRDAIATLRERQLDQAILAHVRSGRPMLGICLGLQLLFERSFEGGQHTGLGILQGEVRRFAFNHARLKVPHMGWNTLLPGPAAMPLIEFSPPPAVYFVHSYHAVPSSDEVVSAWCDYGDRFCAAVRQDNVMAVQFHPEKSHSIGLAMLDRFGRM